MYRVEIWQEGTRLAGREFSELEAARKFYRRFFFRDDCGVELYRDGERLKYKEAWGLMAKGLPYMNYRSRRRAG